MDGNNHQGGEVSMMKKTEVVVTISNNDHELKVFESLPQCENELASKSLPVPPLNCDSPEIRFIPSPNKSPKYPATNENLTPRKTFVRSVYSKPKSRFGEQPYHFDETLLEENVTCLNLQEQLAFRNSFNKESHSPLTASQSSFSEDEDPDEIIYRKVEFSKGKHKILLTTKVLIELSVFVCIAGSLLASLIVEELRRTEIWSLGLWRWCMLVLTLSGPPLMDEAEKVGGSQSIGHFSFRSTTGKGGIKKEVIDMAKLHKMKQEKVSAWTMKILVDAVMNSRLSTISNSLDESFYDVKNEQTDKEITNEMEATAAAYYVFKNLKVYQERRALAHALCDTKTAVKQLNKLVTGVLVLVTIVVWLLLMEIATTKVLVFLSSQLVLAGFMFGNTCKNIFEAIIFVFVMHPFDVGDRCVVDGVELLVEEMNIMTTIFLKLNNEKVYYPNSILATKPISNYYRSPNMVDGVEFSIDFTTPAEKIGALNEKIQRYLERNPQYWHPNFGLFVIEIENVNKIKMGLYVTHTMNFQDFGEKIKRKSELVMEVKRIFEELNIRYNLLPQSVHLRHLESDTSYLK
ncbi:hypothetical protein TSUD_314870 [Trifolium subterraneum]|uniref:Mechanosensitive ion channel MscS domain-containing protein n=1 Tax=Trifolium subterraneum TaxID=3900 RepID=A0A2Z6MSL6_TRISU|nr:hypothetical protein TSUD_314870 [Trifolium subterraneum]